MIRINGKRIFHCTISELREYFIGRKYGRLTITNVERVNRKGIVDYICDCGKVGRTCLSYIIYGYTLSCGGCVRAENRILSKSPNYYIVNPDGTVSVVASNDPNIIFTVDLYTWVWLSHLTWMVNNNGYMAAGLLGHFFTYHSLLYPIPPGTTYVRDHRNRCKLDNRYCNLRVVPQSNNRCNTSKRKNCTTDIIGVYKCDGKYRATINVDNHRFRLLKQFDTLEEAVAQREEWEETYQQIEELNVPPLFLPNGELNVYNFPFHWYSNKYIKLWGALGIRVLPYPYTYDRQMNTLNRLYNHNNY